jgi:acyl-CoA thioester hydrolase
VKAPYEFAVRVYWEDTDAGGVVFYANYLKFFERARTEWLRTMGHEQQRLKEEGGAMFVVTDTRTRHLRPARLDDQLYISVALAERSRATLTLVQQARRGDELLAEGEIRIACVEPGTFRPRRIPTPLLEAIEQHVAPQ